MVYLYIIGTAFSVIMYFWLYLIDVKKSLCQNIMMLIIIFSNIGYLNVYYARDLGEAVLASKIVYLSGCFLPMLFFFSVCEVCHYHLRRRIEVCLIAFQILVFSCVCSIGFVDFYYKSVSYYKEGDRLFLIKEYGPLHSLYIITMFAYFFAGLILAIRSDIKKAIVNHKEVRTMVTCAAITMTCFFAQKLFGFELGIMSFGYIIMMIGTMVPLYHSNLFSVSENKNIVQEQMNAMGFMTFSRKLEFMGCNEFAENVFEELKNCDVGRKIDNHGKDLGKILDGLKRYSESISPQNRKEHSHIKFSTLNIKNNHYETKIHTINNIFGKCVGFTVEITDETAHYKIIELTNKYNDELTKEVQEKTKFIRSIQDNTILGMAQMVESRDLSTGGHIRRTSDVVRIFSEKLLHSGLGLSKEYLDLVIRSAPMHDLGKIGVDDAILRKNGKFNDKEYEQMKSHAAIGGKMVTDILSGVEESEFVTIAHNVANYHHEKVNGTGYPEGLKGDEIPLEARIMALADVFDALVSKRCYKEAFSYDKAFSIISEDAGKHFDARLANIFLNCRPELEEYYNTGDRLTRQ